MKQQDELIRFLLPEARARGAIIRGKHILEEAKHIHGLKGQPAMLFGQTLLASVILLSISKGGVRQVLQLDSNVADAPMKRMQSESKSGAVRGYVQWQEEAVHSCLDGQGIAAWMGKGMLLSTVRDLGIGQPYVSTVQQQSDWFAEHILEYLRQSVQVQADVILQDDLALMIEAMPGCDDEYWFKAVESMAKISNEAIKNEAPEQILKAFDDLGCKIVGRDVYAYKCFCSEGSMQQALASLTQEEIHDLADEQGEVSLSCQYCKHIEKVNVLDKGDDMAGEGS